MQITAAMVKQLRDRTGAGMMDCKNALAEAEGNEDKAVDIIQKKGLAKVAKKSGAIATEGVIHAYIHPGSRLGVLLEVNCQTDFVARNEDFKEFVEDTCLQIASMSPQFVRTEDITDEAKAKQKEIFVGQLEEEEKQTGKKRPPQAIEKIIEGKLAKWIKESCLVDQPSIKDGDKTVQQLCEELSVKIGEKVSIRRFTRFELGEGLEKADKKDFASEVADTLQSQLGRVLHVWCRHLSAWKPRPFPIYSDSTMHHIASPPRRKESRFRDSKSVNTKHEYTP